MPGQRWLAEPDLGRLRGDPGTRVDRRRRFARALFAIAATADLGGLASLGAPVVEASQFNGQARPQFFLRLVEDLQGRGAASLLLGQPGEGQAIAKVAGILGLGRGQQGRRFVMSVLSGEHIGLEEGQPLDGSGIRKDLLGRLQLPFHVLPTPRVTRRAASLLDGNAREIKPKRGNAIHKRYEEA